MIASGAQKAIRAGSCKPVAHRIFGRSRFVILGRVFPQRAQTVLAATFVFAAVSLAHPDETSKTEQKHNNCSDRAAHEADGTKIPRQRAQETRGYCERNLR